MRAGGDGLREANRVRSVILNAEEKAGSVVWSDVREIAGRKRDSAAGRDDGFAGMARAVGKRDCRDGEQQQKTREMSGE